MVIRKSCGLHVTGYELFDSKLEDKKLANLSTICGLKVLGLKNPQPVTCNLCSVFCIDAYIIQGKVTGIDLGFSRSLMQVDPDSKGSFF